MLIKFIYFQWVPIHKEIGDKFSALLSVKLSSMWFETEQSAENVSVNRWMNFGI